MYNKSKQQLMNEWLAKGNTVTKLKTVKSTGSRWTKYKDRDLDNSKEVSKKEIDSWYLQQAYKRSKQGTPSK